jgi:hypothetical protein
MGRSVCEHGMYDDDEDGFVEGCLGCKVATLTADISAYTTLNKRLERKVATLTAERDELTEKARESNQSYLRRAEQAEQKVATMQAVVDAASILLPLWQDWCDKEGGHEKNGHYLWNTRAFYNFADEVRECVAVKALKEG